MKRPGFDGGFFLCFALNLVFSAYWALPGVILIILHFTMGIPLWVGVVALIAWVVIMFGITAFLSWAVSSNSSSESRLRGKTTIRYSSQQHYDAGEEKPDDPPSGNGRP